MNVELRIVDRLNYVWKIREGGFILWYEHKSLDVLGQFFPQTTKMTTTLIWTGLFGHARNYALTWLRRSVNSPLQ